MYAHATYVENIKIPIDSFQSRDRLEDLEGKTSIELLHKRVNFSCFPAANI